MERPIKVMAASFRELSVRRGWGVVEPQEVVNPQAARSRSGHTQSTVLSGASLRVKSHSLDPGQSLKTPGLLSTSPSLSYAEDWNSETKRVSKFFHGLYVPSALCGKFQNSSSHNRLLSGFPSPPELGPWYLCQVSSLP